MSHPLNGFFRASYLNKPKLDERKFGMSFWATRMLRYEETITLPSGWKVDRVPEAQTIDSPAVSLSFKATPGDNSLTYRFEFALKKGTVPADEYPEFKKAVDTMYDIADDWVVCSRTDSGSSPTQVASERAG